MCIRDSSNSYLDSYSKEIIWKFSCEYYRPGLCRTRNHRRSLLNLVRPNDLEAISQGAQTPLTWARREIILEGAVVAAKTQLQSTNSFITWALPISRDLFLFAVIFSVAALYAIGFLLEEERGKLRGESDGLREIALPVSYTHLTLPTILRV